MAQLYNMFVSHMQGKSTDGWEWSIYAMDHKVQCQIDYWEGGIVRIGSISGRQFGDPRLVF